MPPTILAKQAVIDLATRPSTKQRTPQQPRDPRVAAVRRAEKTVATPTRTSAPSRARKIAQRNDETGHVRSEQRLKEEQGIDPRFPGGSMHDVNGPVRLSKRMSELGLCSRREADALIERGWVYVDGERVSELGTKILPHQKIVLNQAARNQQQSRVTILLNKPIGFVSGQPEPGYKPAVLLINPQNLMAGQQAWQPEHMRSLAPAGRLDIDSTGLLVMTQDGRVAKTLIGEDSEIDKEYLVRVEGRLTVEGMKLLNHGMMLDGVKLKPAEVTWQNEDQLRFVLWEGRHRQIRRMCELVGLRVVGLKRIRIGRVLLGTLPVGQWRFLAPHEAF